MRHWVLIIISPLIVSALFGQADKVTGGLSSVDTATLKILNIYPDSFPNVSVVFKAERSNGEPVWNLTKDKMIVTENSVSCEVISIKPISEDSPMNLSIIMDHSGSMMYDYDSDIDYASVDYKTPLHNAKDAVYSFISSFNSSKDLIGLIGFSSTVDIKIPPTIDTHKIKTAVQSMEATESTALYDALIAGVHQLDSVKGLKVIVALTDGLDNLSSSTWRDVVNAANKSDIPVYIIGLGDAEKDTLKMIAENTKGEFFYTTNSNSLQNIYSLISKKLQAFYDLVYLSNNFSSADTTRVIKISFNVDSLYLNANPLETKIPLAVISYLKEKELQKTININDKDSANPLFIGGLALVVLVSAGLLLYYYRKIPATTSLIKRLYPNPTHDFINIDYEGSKGLLQIFDKNGSLVETFDIDNGTSRFQIDLLPAGNYVVNVLSNGVVSSSLKFIKLP